MVTLRADPFPVPPRLKGEGISRVIFIRDAVELRRRRDEFLRLNLTIKADRRQPHFCSYLVFFLNISAPSCSRTRESYGFIPIVHHLADTFLRILCKYFLGFLQGLEGRVISKQAALGGGMRRPQRRKLVMFALNIFLG